MDALLIIDSVLNVYKTVPIRILKITNDFYPIKFEYKSRGYKGLVFSERKSNLIF